MSRECAICHGASYGFTVGLDEEGHRVLVHATSCASILSERRQAAAQAEEAKQLRDGKRVSRKTTRTTMWTAGWEPGRFGPQHTLPCKCPKHREEAIPSRSKDITWDRVLAGDPDLEYQ